MAVPNDCPQGQYELVRSVHTFSERQRLESTAFLREAIQEQHIESGVDAIGGL
jgi:hypothetical protein